MSQMSQTQLANFATIAGLLVLIAGHFGYVINEQSVAFILAALWSLGWSAYNYWQRYKKGDLTLAGIRKF